MLDFADCFSDDGIILNTFGISNSPVEISRFGSIADAQRAHAAPSGSLVLQVFGNLLINNKTRRNQQSGQRHLAAGNHDFMRCVGERATRWYCKVRSRLEKGESPLRCPSIRLVEPIAQQMNKYRGAGIGDHHLHGRKLPCGAEEDSSGPPG